MHVSGPIAPVVREAARFELADFVSREPSLAVVVVATFFIDLVMPALKLPDWVDRLALTAIAWGGLALGVVGMQRRDVAR